MAECRFLLDTNICIYLLGGQADALRARVQSHAPGEVASSVISYAELLRGIDPTDEKALAKVKRLFTRIGLIEFGIDAALQFARLPFRRHSFDRLIAAHALSMGTVLVTNNEADFADVPGLRIENWTT